MATKQINAATIIADNGYDGRFVIFHFKPRPNKYLLKELPLMVKENIEQFRTNRCCLKCQFYN